MLGNRFNIWSDSIGGSIYEFLGKGFKSLTLGDFKTFPRLEDVKIKLRFPMGNI